MSCFLPGSVASLDQPKQLSIKGQVPTLTNRETFSRLSKSDVGIFAACRQKAEYKGIRSRKHITLKFFLSRKKFGWLDFQIGVLFTVILIYTVRLKDWVEGLKAT